MVKMMAVNIYVTPCFPCVCVGVWRWQHCCTSAGNSFLSTVCSEPQALVSPQWKWNWQSLNLSSRGPPCSAATRKFKDMKISASNTDSSRGNSSCFKEFLITCFLLQRVEIIRQRLTVQEQVVQGVNLTSNIQETLK